MGSTLTPVQAGEREATTKVPGAREIDPNGFKTFDATVGEIVPIVVGGTSREPLERDEAIVKRDGHRPGHVIVASPRSPETVRRRRYERVVGSPDHDTERLQRTGHIFSGQTVVAMFPLDEHLDELFRSQPTQVHAGRRRAYVADDRELRAGPSVTIRQAEEHAGPRRFADRGRDSRDSHVELDIHTFIVNELSSRDNCHTRRPCGRRNPQQAR
jgi:hypothetical protein